MLGASEAGRLRGRLPRVPPALALELALLAVLALQCARLLWALVTPIGPVGDWKAPAAMRAAPAGALGAFDPFFRSAAQRGPAVVTALDLKLYGVREDRATGRGSAIISTPDGQQGSYAVGEEIMPGVTLIGVGFDSVTISRGGVSEQIFLDQSSPAQPAAASPPAAPGDAPAAAREPAPQIRMTPRMSGGRVTGIIVHPGGSGDAFRAAGFAPGDVIVSVNGRPITTAEQARSLVEGARGEVSLVVDRAGRQVPMRVRLNP